MGLLIIGRCVAALYSYDAEATEPINKELIMDTGVEGAHLLHCTETCKLCKIQWNTMILNHSSSIYRIFQIWNILIIKFK